MTDNKPSAQVRASMKYNAANTKQYKISLNKKTDADLIALLDSWPNVQGLIKTALRDYTRRL